MVKLLCGLAFVVVLAGCASDSGNKDAAGESGGATSVSDTNKPNHRGASPGVNMRNPSTEQRGQ